MAKRKGLDLTRIILNVQEKWLANLREIIAKEFSRNAKEWRLEVKRLLSGNCARRGGSNITGYPGRCSGTLERSLEHRTYVRRRKNAVGAGWGRNFTGAYNKSGKDYSRILNNSSKPYGGYQERIYESLDSRMRDVLRHYHSTTAGRKLWQHT